MIEIYIFLFLLLMADAVEAIKCYDEAISIDPDCVLARYDKGIVLRAFGRTAGC